MVESTLQETVHVGLIAGEPLRVEGLRGVFEHQPRDSHADLVPVVGYLDELLVDQTVAYLIVDLNSCALPLHTLKKIHRAKTPARLIVIGPDEDEELVMESILAGARAFVDVTAGPRQIREAIEVVLSGSIWAPRRSLALLIDRLLAERNLKPVPSNPQLTDREQQVLDLILLARSNREIAKELGIEERTVKSHVGKMLRKIGAENRIELSMRALNSSTEANETSQNLR